MKKQSALIILILSIVYNTFGQSFGEHHIITSGSLPSTASSIEVADFNNDGDADIIACSSLGRNIYLLENKGNQEFKVLQELEFDLYEVHEVGSGDINNDGLIDIVYSRFDYSNQLAWLKNKGNNEFEYGGVLFSVTSAGWCTVSFSICDFNGDNYDDVVIRCNELDYNLEVRINNGDGTFGPLFSLIEEGKLKSFECSDIDNDGDIDIVYISKNPYSLIACINNGNGDFTQKVIVDTNYQNPVYAFHSFDSDGDDDIDIFGFAENDSIHLYLNNGGNSFTQIIMPKDSLYRTYQVKSLDFDNDGDLDLINIYMEVLENEGDNTFYFKKDDDFVQYIYEYEIYDLNNNGDEDIVYSCRHGGIGYIEDASFENLKNWRILTSQVGWPKYPAYEKINDDEFPDICVLDDQYKYVFYLNNGFGEFPDTITTDILHAFSFESVFYDVNKDGFCDIVSYADYEYSSFSDSINFKLAKNNGDNTFTTIYDTNFNHLQNRHASFNDYNNDSILNAVLISKHSSGGTDTIYFLNINPDFTVSNYDTIVFSTPIIIEYLKFYDVDKNGENDIIMNNGHSLYIGYSVNGRFTNHIDTIFYSPDRIFDFIPANINKDTICDFLIITGNDIEVLESFDGDSIEQTYTLQLNDYPRKLYARDINNDRIDEVLYVSSDKIVLLTNIEHDNFSFEEYNYKNNAARFINNSPFIFSDIDLDGDDDLFCTYFPISDISWFENSYIDAHYTAFPENDAVWTEQNAVYEGNPPQTWTSLYVTESDTFLLDNSYTNIYEYYLNPATFDTIRQLYASIRQDTIAKKVFIIRHYLEENTERLLLDFKVNVGDTVVLDAYYWDLYPQGTDSIYVIDSIATTTLYNNEVRDIFYLSNHKEQFPATLILIEGVGSIVNPFGPATDLVNKKQLGFREFCCPDYLLCLSIGDEHVYVLDDESNCKSLEVWSSVQSNNQNTIFEIFPNPAKDRLFIELKEKLSSGYEVILYNNLGKKVSHYYFEENLSQQPINIDGFKAGIYYIILKNENRFYSSKFIIIK